MYKLHGIANRRKSSDLVGGFRTLITNIPGNLDRHVKTHQGLDKLFSCELCETRFTRKDHLTRHLNTKHANDIDNAWQESTFINQLQPDERSLQSQHESLQRLQEMPLEQSQQHESLQRLQEMPLQLLEQSTRGSLEHSEHEPISTLQTIINSTIQGAPCDEAIMTTLTNQPISSPS